MLRILLCVCLLISSGCGPDSVNVDEVHPSKLGFCVPAEYEIPDVVSVLDSPQYASGGVAFKGCFRNPRVGLDGCVFPSNLINGGVGPPRDGVSWLWNDMPWNAHNRQLVSHPATTVEHLDRDLVRLDNPEGWNWYVWRKQSGAVAAASDTALAVEELMAICRETPSGAACRRNVQTESFLLTYSFLNNTAFSVKSLRDFDDAVIGFLEGWKCASL